VKIDVSNQLVSNNFKTCSADIVIKCEMVGEEMRGLVGGF
jgi:hypothetical protein